MRFIDVADKYNINTAGDIIAAKIDNVIVSLNDEIDENAKYEFIDTSSLDGIRIYRNTLKFVLFKAVDNLFPNVRLKIHYSINRGSFCELVDYKVSVEDINKIREQMNDIISKAIPIERHICTFEEVRRILGENNREELLDLIVKSNKDNIVLQSMNGLFDYFQGVLAPDTGYVDLFELKHFHDGFLLFYPTRFEPGKLPKWNVQEKLTAAFEEINQWGEAIGVDNINSINEIVKNNEIGEIIRVCEALQEKKIGYIADNIKEAGKNFVFIAGPSSSGKTTFSKRLSIHLRAVGLRAYSISLDDYYKGKDIPRDVCGNKDYETPRAFDVEKFNENMYSLQKDGFALIPKYDFATESRIGYKDFGIDDKSVVIVEGIHGMNPEFSQGVDREKLHKLYITALTSINIDDHNRLATTDARLFRRLVRDYKYRASSAIRTLGMWSYVRKGEDEYIFPYQEEADEIFNSSLIYEQGVLKKYAVPILEAVEKESAHYSQAIRLLEILSYFLDIEDIEIPNTSLIREFIGGSVLRY